MRVFFKGVIRVVLFCAAAAVLFLVMCAAAGLLEIPVPEFREASAEVPEVYVIEPQTREPEETDVTETDEKEAVPEETEELSEEEEPVLLFAGDLFLTELMQSKYDQSGISAAVSEELLETVRAADVFMVNQEFPFGTTGEPAQDKQYTFRVNPGYVSFCTDLGIDLVTLANNHMLDFGRGPLSETLKTLDQAGIGHVGAGENLDQAKAYETFTLGDRTVAFLGASRVIPEYSWNASASASGLFTTYDASLLLEQIGKAREACDYVIVYVHWGVERSNQPEDYQKSLARQYIDAGADAVIGAHPHVLQGIEYYQGKPIFYSLGNFIFSNGTYETMLVQLTLEEEQMAVRVLPCVSEANRMRLLESQETETRYRQLEELSFGISIDEDGRVSGQDI